MNVVDTWSEKYSINKQIKIIAKYFKEHLRGSPCYLKEHDESISKAVYQRSLGIVNLLSLQSRMI